MPDIRLNMENIQNVIFKVMRKLLLLSVWYGLSGCTLFDKDPLIEKDDTYEYERNNTLFAFVGEKIDVVALPYEEGSMDGKFKASYKVLQRVYGHYSGGSIEFIAYDHYGTPEFSGYKNVLLFLSEEDGKYYHEKYMFNPVYKTRNGRWAGPYAGEDYSHSYNDSTTVKPEIIDFVEEVKYPLTIKGENGNIREFDYPEPYYHIQSDTATAVYGNYVEELFRLKKEGVLTARKLFGPTRSSDLDTNLHDVQLAGGIFELKSPSPDFIAFWKKMALAIQAPDIETLRRNSFDSLEIRNLVVAFDEFVLEHYVLMFNVELTSSLSKDANVKYEWEEYYTPYRRPLAENEALKTKGKLCSIRVLIPEKDSDGYARSLVLEFFPTPKGYKLASCDYCPY